MNSLIFDSTKILFPKHLVLTYSLIVKVRYALSDTFYRIEIELLFFKLCTDFVQMVFSQNELKLLGREQK